jgi:plastocyanin
MNRYHITAAIIVIALLILLIAPRGGTALAQLAVKGRVELLNSKNKARNGKPDASGVAVWLEAIGKMHQPAGRQRRTLIQRSKRFIPHVMAIELGTEVDFPNQDPFFHNVFSVYNGKRFDLGLYASGETRPVFFNRPGISYIFCNIHPQMSAVVVALNTPYYAVSDQDGYFSITNVPEGHYRLQVWHERSQAEHLAAQSRNLNISPATADLGVIRLSEEGYVVKPHLNKHGEVYTPERNKPAYKKQ